MTVKIFDNLIKPVVKHLQGIEGVAVTDDFNLKSESNILVHVRLSGVSSANETAACYFQRYTISLVIMEHKPQKNGYEKVLNAFEMLNEKIKTYLPPANSKLQLVSRVLRAGPVNVVASRSGPQACMAEMTASFDVDYSGQF